MISKIISMLTVISMLGTYPVAFADDYIDETESVPAVAEQTETEPPEVSEIADAADEELEIEDIDENYETGQLLKATEGSDAISASAPRLTESIFDIYMPETQAENEVDTDEQEDIKLTVAAAYGDLTYQVNNGEVIITDSSSTATTVDIPAEIDGYPVTSIGDCAFSYCKELTSVVIPEMFHA